MKNLKIKLGYKSYTISCNEDEEVYTKNLVDDLNKRLEKKRILISANLEHSTLLMLLLLELQDENSKIKNKVQEDRDSQDAVKITYANLMTLQQDFKEFSNYIKGTPEEESGDNEGNTEKAELDEANNDEANNTDI